MQPPLHVPAQHAQPVGGVFLQVVDRDTAVWRQEVRDLFGLVWAGGVHWAIGQVAANQPGDRELCIDFGNKKLNLRKRTKKLTINYIKDYKGYCLKDLLHYIQNLSIRFLKQ